jgi:integrase
LVETHAGVVEKDTKTHAERRITLDDGTTSILEAHRARHKDIAARCDVRLGSTSYVFSHDVDGLTPWRPNYVTLAFSRLRDELGLEGVRLHDLRHFNATNMLANGADIRTVSGRLGHADAATTLNVYAHFMERADREAASAIGATLDGVP